jgi:hypothetical protein
LIWLEGSESGTSQGTLNKLQVSTDIAEKALQTPVNSTQLLNVQNHSAEDQRDEHFYIIFYICPTVDIVVA